MAELKTERLHKRIAASGFCSRRAAETLIVEGRVTVNGELVVELGTKVGPEDVVAIDGRDATPAKLYTLLLNKPKGYVTTLSDPHAKRTIADLLPDLGVQLKPVGRLDKDTEGLLIITNDGDLALRLAHPRYGMEKEYLVIVEGVPDEKALEKLRKGVFIEGGRTMPAQISRVERSPSSLRIVLHEGRKRQVRQMCLAVGHPVKSLKRVRIGNLRLRGIPRGTCRMLGKMEVDELRKSLGLGRV